MACSWECWGARQHPECPRLALLRRDVGLSEFEEHSNLPWALLTSGANPITSPSLELASFSEKVPAQLVVLPVLSFAGYLGDRTVRIAKRPLGVAGIAQDQSIVRRDNNCLLYTSDAADE